jgi:hypothetical protein
MSFLIAAVATVGMWLLLPRWWRVAWPLILAAMFVLLSQLQTRANQAMFAAAGVMRDTLTGVEGATDGQYALFLWVVWTVAYIAAWGLKLYSADDEDRRAGMFPFYLVAVFFYCLPVALMAREAGVM